VGVLAAVGEPVALLAGAELAAAEVLDGLDEGLALVGEEGLGARARTPPPSGANSGARRSRKLATPSRKSSRSSDSSMRRLVSAIEASSGFSRSA